MSLMAGFDLVTEISNTTVLKLIETNLQIDGVAAIPPFELTLPLSSDGGTSGMVHLIVTDLQVDLNAGDTITLTFVFDRASVTMTAPLPLVICPLDGNFTITATLQLVNAGRSNKRVSIAMATATATIDWSSASNQEIAKDLAGTPISTATFNSLATQMLTSHVQSIPASSIPIGFRVVPGTDGSLSPTLQFEHLEVHCIPNTERSKQALGIFGILLAVNHANGDHNQKTSSAITATDDGICINIAPGVFHSLIFCPAVAKALSTDVGNLPGSCGSAGGIDTQGVTVNSISDSFANGYIDINGSVSTSGFCYDANGTFHGTVTFSISRTRLTPYLNMDEPDVDVDIPWYCWVAVGVIFGPIGLVLTGVVEAVAEKIATDLAENALKNALGGGIPGAAVSGLSGASFYSVAITAEGITLQGTVPLSVLHPPVAPMLHMSGSVMTTQSEVVGSGVFRTKVWCLREERDYPYTEYLQQQMGIYQLSGTLVSQPLTPHFTIGSNVPLTGTSGTIALPNVYTYYPTPLPGGSAMIQTVHIGYSISGTSIQLTNVPSEGNYVLHFGVTATDCEGNPVKGDANRTLSTWFHVQFEGHKVEMEGTYQLDVQKCAYQGWIDKMAPRQKVPRWQQINYPSPESLIEYIRDLVALGTPQADEILVASKLAHGSSYYRALLSPAAHQPGLLRAKSNIPGSQQVTNIAHDLTNLAQQLLKVSDISQVHQVIPDSREIKG